MLMVAIYLLYLLRTDTCSARVQYISFGAIQAFFQGCCHLLGANTMLHPIAKHIGQTQVYLKHPIVTEVDC